MKAKKTLKRLNKVEAILYSRLLPVL